jgi:transposase
VSLTPAPLSMLLEGIDRRMQNRNKGALPEHLPWVEDLIDVEDKACLCCGKPLHITGEDRAEICVA